MNPEKIQQLQFLEQNLQSIIMQKQAFQMELTENNSALQEVEKSEDIIYKVIGQLMISVPKEETIQELSNKKRLIQTRIDALGKQEESMMKQLHEAKDQVISENKQ